MSYKMVIKANHDRFSTPQQELEAYQSTSWPKSITENESTLLCPHSRIFWRDRSPAVMSEKNPFLQSTLLCLISIKLTTKWPLAFQGNIQLGMKKCLWTPAFVHHKMLFTVVLIYHLGICQLVWPMKKMVLPNHGAE